VRRLQFVAIATTPSSVSLKHCDMSITVSIGQCESANALASVMLEQCAIRTDVSCEQWHAIETTFASVSVVTCVRSSDVMRDQWRVAHPRSRTCEQ